MDGGLGSPVLEDGGRKAREECRDVEAAKGPHGGPEVTFMWTKGHDGHALNERADALAREMAASYGARA